MSEDNGMRPPPEPDESPVHTPVRTKVIGLSRVADARSYLGQISRDIEAAGSDDPRVRTKAIRSMRDSARQLKMQAAVLESLVDSFEDYHAS